MPRSKTYHLLPRIDGRPSDGKAAGVLRPAVRSYKPTLNAWRGRGVDAWVDALSEALSRRTRSGAFEKITVENQSRTVQYFFEFLLSTGGSGLAARGLPHLTSIDMAGFADWLGSRATECGWKPSTARTVFTRTKAILLEALKMAGDVRDPRHLFPKNPFPGSYGSEEVATPLSQREFDALASAVKKALSDHHHGRRLLTGAALPTARILVIALRTGMNRMSLVELKQSCLSDGLLPGTKLLHFTKHRGKTVQVKALKGGEAVLEQSVVPMDAVAILEWAITEARALRQEAAEGLQDYLWLYRKSGTVQVLQYGTFDWALKSLVARWRVLGDDGEPLLVNASRLRSTFASMAWRVTDGDPIAVAGLLGNTPRIADSHYLRATKEDMAGAAGFMAAGLKELVTSSGRPALASQESLSVNPDSCGRTPSGRCGRGQQQDDQGLSSQGTCVSFDRCLGCSAFVVVGEIEDLWRLFSYQRYLHAQMEHLLLSAPGSEFVTWSEEAIAFMDDFTGKHFDKRTVRMAKERAIRSPHPFWAAEISKASFSKGLDS